MPAVELCVSSDASTVPSPLPRLLQTPSGLAIIEIQGTIHHPSQHIHPDDSSASQIQTQQLGLLEFPLYDANSKDDEKWMKKVYLYIGKHQRLTGEVKKLAKPLAIIRKVESAKRNGGHSVDHENDGSEALEIVEVVKFKILFSGRPEPVGD